ncbi:hypothetical protein QVD17_35276 [Tagetes erecta]|uniref:Uncharacterized protein n=1 Tax=Tagetes erecta TaxID=13708 RepID=A0AAD8K3A7_TARER|nr:hypothetical protein QVD17_35276 [Tagetes erecta]
MFCPRFTRELELNLKLICIVMRICRENEDGVKLTSICFTTRITSPIQRSDCSSSFLVIVYCYLPTLLKVIVKLTLFTDAY